MEHFQKGLVLVFATCFSAVSWGQNYDQPAYGQQQYADPAGAQAEQPQFFGYVGLHPVPYDQGAGICETQEAHFHPYAPFDQYLFREHEGYFYFVGDPVDFGYSGPAYAYQANHPIPLGWGGGYCYIQWNHRHPYIPPSSWSFNYVGGAYLYVGAWDPWYFTYQNAFWNYYGGFYRNSYWGGRYYAYRPPHLYGWRNRPGATGVYTPGVTVAAPGGVRVTVPQIVGAGAGGGLAVAPPAPAANLGHRSVVTGRSPIAPGQAGTVAPFTRVGPPTGYGNLYVAPPVARAVPVPPVNPQYAAPSVNPQYATPPVYSAPAYRSPGYGYAAPPVRVAPPVYSAPRAPVYSAPAYSAPRAPVYSAPRAPVYSAPPSSRPTYVAPAPMRMAPSQGFSAPMRSGAPVGIRGR